MKTLALAIFFSALTTNLVAQKTQLSIHTDLIEATIKAGETGKPIFAYVFDDI